MRITTAKLNKKLAGIYRQRLKLKVIEIWRGRSNIIYMGFAQYENRARTTKTWRKGLL